MYRQKFATKRVKYLDVVLIPRYNLYKSNIEGPSHMLKISPPSVHTEILEPSPIQNHWKNCENDPLATYSGHLKGGVRDPLLADPAYIEGIHLSKQV